MQSGFGERAAQPSRLACERATEGNPNLGLRVRTDARSVVVKQSRPWPEKSDPTAPPLDRVLVEARFYERAAAIPEVGARMPRLLAADAVSRTLLFEDLGPACHLSNLYTEADLSAADAVTLGTYLRHLHEATRGESDAVLANRELRRLHHRQLFEIPLARDNGLALEAYEPGLHQAATRLCQDAAFRAAALELGRRYLDDGPVLVHGDYFPGSWLRTGDGLLRVIGPEHCFYGDAEFDLGVAVAHLVLSRQYFGIDEVLIGAAVDPRPDVVVEEALVAQYAGIEVMRRLIGADQLPIAPTTGFRANMLERARVALLEQTLEAFRT